MLKAALALALAASLALKAIAGTATEPRDAERLSAALEALLQAKGFSVEHVPGMAEPMLRASRGECGAVLVEMRAQGWNLAMISELARPGDRVDYVFRGEATPTPPTTEATWRYQVTRILRQVGLPAQWSPVVAVIAPERCPRLGLDWDKVSRL